MLGSHKLLAAKIKAEIIDMEIPKNTMVQLIDLAVPPQSPVEPNRSLGGALLVSGLILMLIFDRPPRICRHDFTHYEIPYF